MPPNFFDKIIISDTSCLIALSNTGNLDILRQVCKTILITPEIAGEYGEDIPAWITVTPVRDAEISVMWGN
jgi:predicted nucleic acid-binding protein